MHAWMKNLRYAVALICLIGVEFTAPYIAEAQTGGIKISKIVASGLSEPVAIVNAKDGSNRLFLVEQHSGLVRILKNGSLLATPFLNLGGSISQGSEQGLLGLAFHPNYATNGYFYVYYTDKTAVGNTVVARYHVSGNPDVADAASKTQVLSVVQPYANHNGGTLRFGPDGFLYIGLGDGGSGGDPQNNGQNIENLLGKVLRIDVNSGSPYGIPASNPFVNSAGRDEIWAYGLRNPWQFSFDRLTGDLYIGDVGQNLYEEINFQAAGTAGGLNFGWRCMEGNHLYNSAAPCNSAAYLSTLTAPVAEYSHSQGYSVTGGYVYRGNLFPGLRGKYFYSDLGGSAIWSLKKNSTPPLFASPVVELSNTGLTITAFGEDEQGELYIADYSVGTIRQIEDTSGPSPDLSTAKMMVSRETADRNQTVSYTIQLVNLGGAAAGVNFSNVLPDSLTYVSGSIQGGAGYNGSTRTFSWSGSIAAQSTVTFTYQATVNSSVPDGSINNKALVSASGVAQFEVGVALNVPNPVLQTTHADFILPGTQPGGLSAPFQNSKDCDTCHTGPIYDRWRGSPMSQAGRDPLLWAALRVSNSVAPNSGEFCLRCHTSKGWLEGRSTAADGSSLTLDDLSNGVACLTCHRMVDNVASAGDEMAGTDNLIRQALANQGFLPASGSSGSAMMIIDPNDNRRGPFSLPVSFGYHVAKRTDLLGQSGNAVTRSRMCGTCHNVSNPLLSWDAGRQQYWPNAVNTAAPSSAPEALFPIERTFDEWSLSTYANGGVVNYAFAGSKPGGLVETCQDCHMPRTTGKAADDGYNPIQRDCVTTGCLPQHDLVGANTWLPQLLQFSGWRLNAVNDTAHLNQSLQTSRNMLQKAARITVEMGEPSGGVRTVNVRVYNQSGHKLPTGYPEGRRMWLNVEAYSANGQLVYQSGAYDAASATLSIDGQTKVYEAKYGITPELSALVGIPAGESFYFSLNNTVIKDNRIPPQGYLVSAFDKSGLRPVGVAYGDGQYWDDSSYQVPDSAERVLVRLYYQTASKEYIQFLEQYGGLDGESLAEMWNTLKSPPELMAVGFTPVFTTYLGVVNR